MRAYLKNYRQSPRKVRLVADLIRGKSVERALATLSFLGKRASLPLKKLLESAVSNARAQGKDPKNLAIGSIRVDEGITFKRLEYRARGSANIIQKRTSHIDLVLEEQAKEAHAEEESSQETVSARKLKTKN